MPEANIIGGGGDNEAVTGEEVVPLRSVPGVIYVEDLNNKYDFADFGAVMSDVVNSAADLTPQPPPVVLSPPHREASLNRRVFERNNPVTARTLFVALAVLSILVERQRRDTPPTGPVVEHVNRNAASGGNLNMGGASPATQNSTGGTGGLCEDTDAGIFEAGTTVNDGGAVDPLDSGTGTNEGNEAGAAGSGGAPLVVDSGTEAGVGGTGGATGKAKSPQEDHCGPRTFAIGNTLIDDPSGSKNPCEFITDTTGRIEIRGHTLINSNEPSAIPRECFFSEPWADAALKLDGVAKSPAPKDDTSVPKEQKQKGSVTLNEGKLCVTMLHEDPTQTEIATHIPGPATLHVVTKGKVKIEKLPPRWNEQYGRMMTYVRVTAIDQEALITQDFRYEEKNNGDVGMTNADGGIPDEPKLKQDILNPGDTPAEYPIDIVQQEGWSCGCYIASPEAQNDNNEQELPKPDTGAIVMGASGVFMVLRRKNRPDRRKAA